VLLTKQKEMVADLTKFYNEFKTKITHMYELGVIDNLWADSDPYPGYNDTFFDHLLTSTTKDLTEQYFEFTDRPYKGIPNKKYCELDNYSIEEKATFNFLLGLFYNFVINDPIIRNYLEFLRHDAHHAPESSDLKVLLRNHSEFMSNYQTQWISELFTLFDPPKVQGRCPDAQFEYMQMALFFYDFKEILKMPKNADVWISNISHSMFDQNVFICQSCMSHKIQKTDKDHWVEVTDLQAQFIKVEPERALKETMKK